MSDGYRAQPTDLSPSDQVGMPLGQQDARVLQPSSPSNALGWAPAPELPAREAEDEADLEEGDPLGKVLSPNAEGAATQSPKHQPDREEASNATKDPDQRADTVEDDESKGAHA